MWKNLMKFIKLLLGLVKQFIKFAQYKINKQKSIVFLYNSNEQLEIKMKNKTKRHQINETGINLRHSRRIH